ncbi:nucleotidyltransferase family protein [Nitrospinota bacterium]
MTFPVAILAGGLATRLLPQSEEIPKSLLDIEGKPFVERQIDLLTRQGIGRIVMCVGHLGEMIREVIGNGARLGAEVSYSFDGPELLGTGGALKRALPQLGDAFFVLYGDSYLPIDYRAAERAFGQIGKPGLMTVFRNEGKWDRSNVLFADGRIARYEKDNPTADMRHIDYGLGILRQEVFEEIPEGHPWDLADIYRDLAGRGELAGFEAADRFYEIGSKRGLEEMRALFSALHGKEPSR